jgi:hypothetical protein
VGTGRRQAHNKGIHGNGRGDWHMNKTTISELVQAQPDDVDLDELIEQLCLLRTIDVISETTVSYFRQSEALAEPRELVSEPS